jgi:hypothetical protein
MMKILHKIIVGLPLAGRPVRRLAPTLQGAMLGLLLAVSASAAEPFADSGRAGRALE